MADVGQQLDTNLFGALRMTWAVLPVMRAARCGTILNISSLGGFMGGELSSLYCISKFGLEGFSECLAKAVAPFGISVTVVEPGSLRTDFLSPNSVSFHGGPIPDYDDRRAALRNSFTSRNGRQPGDAARLAEALLAIVRSGKPPARFVAGTAAANAVLAKLESIRAELEQWRDLAVGTDYPT